MKKVLILIALFSYSANSLAEIDDEETNILDSALPIKTIDAYLTGKSLGLEQVAEINNFPSPRRVLELRRELFLDEAQINRSLMLIKLMRKYSIKAGREIVQKERKLYALFSEKVTDLSTVKQLVADIAELQGKIRFAYLKAHIAQNSFLNENQKSVYASYKKERQAIQFALDE